MTEPIKLPPLPDWFDGYSEADKHVVQQYTTAAIEAALQSQDREDAYDIEAAAKTLADCMDYPWEPMPEKGREAMRKYARRIIDHARRIEGDGE